MNDIWLIAGITLMYSSPLIFASLGGVISENSGVINIGLEGIMTLGAFVGAAACFFSHNPWLGFLAAGAAGAALALLHAVACISFEADQVISGIALNFLGGGLSLFLCRIFFNGSTQTKTIALGEKISRPFDGLFPESRFFELVINQYATVYIALLLVVLLWFLLYRTKPGLRIRAVGEHPKAADTLGINIYSIRYFCVIFSGILAGFGGASMSIAMVSSFRPTLISGQGFIALAAMIFGKWKPQGAFLACLLFGSTQGLVVYLGGRGFDISAHLLAILPYLITLVVLMGFVGRAVAPAADGIPYRKG